MDIYQNALNQINFAEKTEKSLKEFSNWIFGISIGVCSLLIFQIKQFDFTTYQYAKLIYKGIIIYSMFTVFFAGLSKYLILNRETTKGIHYGVLLKLLILKEKKSKEEFQKEWSKTYNKWTEEHNKLKLMSQGLNISIVLTMILVFTTALFILTII
jgi:hypothetical protein